MAILDAFCEVVDASERVLNVAAFYYHSESGSALGGDAPGALAAIREQLDELEAAITALDARLADG